MPASRYFYRVLGLVRFTRLFTLIFLPFGAILPALAYDSSFAHRAQPPPLNATKDVKINIKAGNIYIEKSGHVQQLTSLGRDSDAVFSPDQKFIVFTRSESNFPPDECSGLPVPDQLRRINIDGTSDQLLIAGHVVCVYDQKQFSSDGSLLFFLTPWWVTSSALYVFDFKRGEVRYIAPANTLIVLNFCTDEYQDQLILNQHRYFLGGGSYDWYWLYDRAGTKELGPVGDDNETPATIIQKVKNYICNKDK